MQSKDLSALDHQPELPLARAVSHVDVPVSLIVRQPSLSGAIALCVQASGLDDKEVYMSLGIDAGHWTRIMKGDAHFPVNKLSCLMSLCGNEAPLVWLANKRGYGLVLLKSEAERRAEEAEARAKAAEERARWLEDLIARRAA